VAGPRRGWKPAERPTVKHSAARASRLSWIRGTLLAYGFFLGSYSSRRSPIRGGASEALAVHGGCRRYGCLVRSRPKLIVVTGPAARSSQASRRDRGATPPQKARVGWRGSAAADYQHDIARRACQSPFRTRRISSWTRVRGYGASVAARAMPDDQLDFVSREHRAVGTGSPALRVPPRTSIRCCELRAAQGPRDGLRMIWRESTSANSLTRQLHKP